MRSGRLRHDGNPVLTWCIGNVVGKADRRGNLYPTKNRADQKIDAAVALMMAIGRAMVEDEQAKGLEGFLQPDLRLAYPRELPPQRIAVRGSCNLHAGKTRGRRSCRSCGCEG
jgi:Phage Terminase